MVLWLQKMVFYKLLVHGEKGSIRNSISNSSLKLNNK